MKTTTYKMMLFVASLLISSPVLAQTPDPNAAPGVTPPAPAGQTAGAKAADDHQVLRPALLTPKDAENTFVYLQAFHVKSEEFNSCLLAIRGMPQIEELRHLGIKLREMSFKHYVNPKEIRAVVNDSCHNFDQIITACAKINIEVPDAAGFLQGHLCQNYRELKYDRLVKAKDPSKKAHKKHKRKKKVVEVSSNSTTATPEAAPASTTTTPEAAATTTTPEAATPTATPEATPTATTATPEATAPTTAAPEATPAPTTTPEAAPTTAAPEATAPTTATPVSPTTSAPSTQPTAPEQTPAPTQPLQNQSATQQPAAPVTG